MTFESFINTFCNDRILLIVIIPTFALFFWLSHTLLSLTNKKIFEHISLSRFGTVIPASLLYSTALNNGNNSNEPYNLYNRMQVQYHTRVWFIWSLLPFRNQNISWRASFFNAYYSYNKLVTVSIFGDNEVYSSRLCKSSLHALTIPHHQHQG